MCLSPVSRGTLQVVQQKYLQGQPPGKEQHNSLGKNSPGSNSCKANLLPACVLTWGHEVKDRVRSDIALLSPEPFGAVSSSLLARPLAQRPLQTRVALMSSCVLWVGSTSYLNGGLLRDSLGSLRL